METSAAVPVDPPRTADWRQILALASFLGVSLGLLAWFFAREASRYTLEIPMRTATEQTTQLVFWYEGDVNQEHGVLAGIVSVNPNAGWKLVHFPLGGGNIASFQFFPMLGEGEMDVGAPVVRCDACALLGFDVPFREFKLTDYLLLHQIASADQQGDHLHMVTIPKADTSICGITLEKPLRLGFNVEAFVLTFVPVAFGWTFLTLLAAILMKRYEHPLRARLPGWWRGLLAVLLGARPAARGPTSRREQWAVIAIFVLSAAVQTNAVLHGGSKGQDYPLLYHLSERIVEHPEEPWRFGPTNPPVLMLTNAFFIWLTRGVNGQMVCGFYNLLVNLVALWVFYLLARRFVAGGVWRMALLTLVAFLPVRLIQTVVLAADALVLWPFFTLAWVLAAITDGDTGRTRRRWLALACGGLLTLGVLTTSTFMSGLVAVSLTLVQLARRRQVPWREAAVLLAAALVLPVGVVIDQQRRHPDFTGAMDLKATGYTAMSVRDIAWLHGRDMHIFRAPPYDEPLEVARRVSNGKPFDPGPPYELLTDHQYSYLALNHLAVFTDPMNIFQYDPTDAYFGARDDLHQHLMARAVKTAVPITLACVAAVGLLSALLLGVGLAAPGRSRADLEAVWLLAFGWFGNIVFLLPFIPSAYIAGFWTPRLTMPALLVFLLLTVYGLERLLPGRVGKVAAWVVLGYVLGQSALHVSFLWPWGKIY